MLGGIFEKNDIKQKIKTFEKKITEENFWKDKLSAQKILKEKKFFQDIIENFNYTINEIENLFGKYINKCQILTFPIFTKS